MAAEYIKSYIYIQFFHSFLLKVYSLGQARFSGLKNNGKFKDELRTRCIITFMCPNYCLSFYH